MLKLAKRYGSKSDFFQSRFHRDDHAKKAGYNEEDELDWTNISAEMNLQRDTQETLENACMYLRYNDILFLLLNNLFMMI